MPRLDRHGFNYLHGRYNVGMAPHCKKIFPVVAAVIVIAGAFGYRVHLTAVTVPLAVTEAAASSVSPVPTAAVSSTTVAWVKSAIAAVVDEIFDDEAVSNNDHAVPDIQPSPPATVPVAPPSAARVPILTYHGTRWARRGDTPKMRSYDVTPAVLEQQLQYLHDHGYVSVSFDQLARALAGKIQLPKKPIIISFDDGWVSQYREAFPRLKKYQLSATFFVSTEKIGRHPSFMTWEQLRDMAAAGMEIGSHTLTHPRLDRIRDNAELQREIGGSKLVLEQQLGHPITTFAYPYGLSTDHVVAMVQAAGYTTARGVSFGLTHTAHDRFTLKTITAPRTLDAFIRILERE